MSKKNFSNWERQTVYDVHGPQCYLCSKPVEFALMQVDHVIPESLLSDPEMLRSVLDQYGLPAEFDLNSFENWLPSCGPCNRTKRDDLSFAPILSFHLNQAAKKADQARSLLESSISKLRYSRAVNTVAHYNGVEFPEPESVASAAHSITPVAAPPPPEGGLLSILLERDQANARLITEMKDSLTALTVNLGGPTEQTNRLEAHWDTQIDQYRDMVNSGEAETALGLFRALYTYIKAEASGRILFRLDGNIANCLFRLRREEEAASVLIAAYDHAPLEPMALPNKALGLLLAGDHEAVLRMGLEFYASSDVNEQFSAHVIQAASVSGDIADPLSLIAPVHRETAIVTRALINFYRRRGDGTKWRKLAATALSRFPNDVHIKQHAAEAELDEILLNTTYRETGVLTESLRIQVVDACLKITAVWEHFLALDGGQSDDAMTCLGNLMLAHRVLGEVEQAVRHAKMGLSLGYTAPEFLEKALYTALEAGADDDSVDEMLKQVRNGPEKALMAARVLLARSNWSALAAYSENQLAAIPEEERLLFRIVVDLARVRTGPVADQQTSLKSLVEQISDDVRSLAAIADTCCSLGHSDVAAAAYAKAKLLISSSSHASGRQMLAQYAHRMELWADVIDLLDGYVDKQVDSRELQQLASAFASEKLPKQRAAQFFDSLPISVRSVPALQRIEGHFHRKRGDFEAALHCYQAVQKSSRADDLLSLISLLKVLGKHEEAELHLRDVALDKLPGAPTTLIALAAEMLSTDQCQAALSFSYQLTRSHQRDPAVANAFVQLIFAAARLGRLSAASVVVEDMAFLLDLNEGGQRWLVIDGENEQSSENVISREHYFAVEALGKAVGETVLSPTLLAPDRRATIKEIKHKYLWLFHQIISNFETWYPGASGPSSVNMDDTSIEMITDHVKRLADKARRSAEIYDECRAPLATLAAQVRSDPIRFAQTVRSEGRAIKTYSGDPEELRAALGAVNTREGGVVLDSYTAWTAAEIGLFPILKQLFSDIVIPRTVLAELEGLVEDPCENHQESTSLTWRDGHLQAVAYTAEDLTARRKFVLDKLETIKAECRIVAVSAPPSRNNTADELAELFGAEFLFPAAVAADGYLLLTEDGQYRMLAKGIWKLKATWLQPTLDVALSTGLIDFRTHASYVGELAKRGHGIVVLNAQTLFALASDRDDGGWSKYSSAAQWIGGQDADLVSHTSVVAGFARMAFNGRSIVPVHLEKAFGVLLGNLIRDREAEWSKILHGIRPLIGPKAEEYVLAWLKGHFLT